MNLIEKLNSYLPATESEIPIQYFFNGFGVIELFSEELYSLMINYQGNIIFSRATFRSLGCKRYCNKRAIYISDLEQELIKLKIPY